MKFSRNFTLLTTCATMALVHPPTLASPAAPDDQEVRVHVERARNLGREEFAFLLRRYCPAGGAFANDEGKAERAKMEMSATKVFDNLFYVGTAQVGAWIVKTSDGLILIDALNNPEEAQKYIIDGMRDLGLAPRDIKKIIVTHAHGDHFGGAKFLKEKTGARIFMSNDDWAYLEAQKKAAAPPRWLGREPARDGVVSDGETVRLGDTSITFFQTPGHTPGTLSALIPLKDGDRVHTGALWGGTAFPAADLPALRTYEQSLRRFWGVANDAKVDVLLSNHPFLDNGLDHIRTIADRKVGEANPFVIGGARYATFMGTLSECNLAAQKRLEPAE